MSEARPKRDGSHDFDFQTGRWRIRNERLVKRLQGCTEWETFEAVQHARLLPGGIGNMDDFITDHWPGFVGMSLRLYNPRTRQWSIYWATNQTGGALPACRRRLRRRRRRVRGAGRGGRPARPRPLHVVEHHAHERALGAGVLADEGRTWEKNWIMIMTREDREG